jgi:adenylate kinase
MTARTTVVGIVGGASGVGKTSLLNEIDWVDRVNTGDLFKRHMSVADRDEIRSGDWSLVEHLVAKDLSDRAITNLFGTRQTVIDTHFAAKLRGRHYRIGLHRNLIFSVARDILIAAAERGTTVKFRVVHIDSDPYSLLERRRRDTSRKRDLIPSDCVSALARNAACAGHYLHEVARAARGNVVDIERAVQSHRIENKELKTAIGEMKAIFSMEAYDA